MAPQFMSSSPLALLRHLLYGLLMGGADVIPGVSGGTMALIVGVYERLVGAISSAVSFGLALLRLDRDGMRTHWAAVPWGLVLPLAAGIGLAIAFGAHTIPALIQAYPEQMRGLFLGLVGASLFIPALRIDRVTPTHAGISLGCALTAFYLTGLPVLDVAEPGLLRVFLSAAVAICAMILPGVSGAFLLEVLGIYEPTLLALKGVLAFETAPLAYVLTFCAGAATGLGAFAKLLDWLLAHRHDATMAALVGLIAGALRALWPYVGPDRALRLPETGDPVGSVVALTLLGFAAVLGLLWWGRQSRAEPVSSVG
jgi:putative membrane protein